MAEKLMPKTKKAFVTGWPITHSRSPLVHTHWLRLYGLDGVYERLAIEPDEFEQFLDSFQNRGYVGGNITLPHKEAAYAHVVWRDEAAERLGAINTVWAKGKTLWGSNTDGHGFVKNLDEKAPEWCEQAEKKKAVILGAGGASRAIIDALVEAGFGHIAIANRTFSKAANLAEKFGSQCEPISLEDAQGFSDQADLIINTTSLGMKEGDSLPLSFESVKASAIVTDIVYTPLVTPFLRAAQIAGLKTVDGLGMLLHQAAPGFEQWFGTHPRVTKALRGMVERDLGERTLPIMIGLTGSIGMGKSTTAKMFQDAGIPVYDSDAAVHALYEGEAVPLIEAAFPGTVRDGKVDRIKLSALVVGQDAEMKKLEAIVHPLVHRDEQVFREKITKEGHSLAVLDAPLLFERNNADKADTIIVVSAPEDVQRDRVLSRPGMTVDKFEAILARQTPDAEKRAQADHVIDTSLGLSAAKEAVEQLIQIYTPLNEPNHA